MQLGKPQFYAGQRTNANPWDANSACYANAYMYTCPSDGESRSPTKGTSTPVNYVVSLGDTTLGSKITDSRYDGRSKGNTRGYYGARYSYRSMGSISDGTSNTVCFSETLSGKHGQSDRKVGAGITTSETPFAVPGTSNIPYVIQLPRDCLSRRAGKSLTGDVHNDNPRGAAWQIGGPTQTAFSTILPPNSPSCGCPNVTSWDNPNVLSAASNHTGGVNCALVDGSVRFVSETVNSVTAGITDFSDPYSRTDSPNSSPYGVWGAYGTINGGESASL
ncbi:MAG: DUF1559 domain-containing protein [Thermoguttaceae bacterium]